MTTVAFDVGRAPAVPETEAQIRARLEKLIVGTVRERADGLPRQVQRRIGPSEVGRDCERYLGYKVLDITPMNDNAGTSWKSFQGTAMHAMMESIFGEVHSEGELAFGCEERVSMGWENNPLDGTADLYYYADRTVFDWKNTSKARAKKIKADGSPLVYRAQKNLYAKGFVDMGVPVDRVCLIYCPRDGNWSDWVFDWSPVDLDLANHALKRLERIRQKVAIFGEDVLRDMPTADEYCSTCPFFYPAGVKAGHLRSGCPGHHTDYRGRPRPNLEVPPVLPGL